MLGMQTHVFVISKYEVFVYLYQPIGLRVGLYGDEANISENVFDPFKVLCIFMNVIHYRPANIRLSRYLVFSIRSDWVEGPKTLRPVLLKMAESLKSGLRLSRFVCEWGKIRCCRISWRSRISSKNLAACSSLVGYQCMLQVWCEVDWQRLSLYRFARWSWMGGHGTWHCVIHQWGASWHPMIHGIWLVVFVFAL